MKAMERIVMSTEGCILKQQGGMPRIATPSRIVDTKNENNLYYSIYVEVEDKDALDMGSFMVGDVPCNLEVKDEQLTLVIGIDRHKYNRGRWKYAIKDGVRTQGQIFVKSNGKKEDVCFLPETEALRQRYESNRRKSERMRGRQHVIFSQLDLKDDEIQMIFDSGCNVWKFVKEYKHIRKAMPPYDLVVQVLEKARVKVYLKSILGDDVLCESFPDAMVALRLYKYIKDKKKAEEQEKNQEKEQHFIRWRNHISEMGFTSEEMEIIKSRCKHYLHFINEYKKIAKTKPPLELLDAAIKKSEHHNKNNRKNERRFIKDILGKYVLCDQYVECMLALKLYRKINYKTDR